MKKLGVVLVLLLSVFALSACRQRYFGDYKAADFEHISHWEDFADLGEEEPVFVYIYDRDFKGTYRQPNIAANEEVFRFGMENEFGLSMILINNREMQGSSQVAGVRSPNWYPAQLLLVRNGTILDQERSSEEILEWIEEMESGEYEIPGSENGEEDE